MFAKNERPDVLPPSVRRDAITVLGLLDAWTDSLSAAKKGMSDRLPIVDGARMAALDAAYNANRETFWSRWSAWYERAMPSDDLAVIAAVMGTKALGTAVMVDFACYEVRLRHADGSPEVARAVAGLELSQSLYATWHTLIQQLLTMPVPHLPERLEPILLNGQDQLSAANEEMLRIIRR